MGAKLRIQDEPEPNPYPAVDYVCGLRKVGPSKYVLVTGTVEDGVVKFKHDKIPESLDNAAEMLRASFQSLMETLP